MHDFDIINIYVLSKSLYVIYISNRNNTDNYQQYLFLCSLPMAGIFSFLHQIYYIKIFLHINFIKKIPGN